ncbi:cache domain-containing protein [Vogesella sp. DC21W]|uniref:histidine kinase n=1 Tax=Vogesella aquatica TaxID=2984206 RepID=A0ABT5J3J1_9NEIS|nr:ATP-binding protein [Vogesella aquatica]MDC7719135.1 cache domain-containing protein [Vogesella aquatica]
MTTQPAPPPQRAPARLLFGLLLIALIAALSGWASWRTAQGELREVLSHRLALYATALDAELDRFEALPYVVSRDPNVGNLLGDAANPALQARINRYLADVNGEAGTAQLFVLDRRGTTLASSNWQSGDSLIGNNYAFRPYFRAALRGETGRFFGVGATTRQPGMFIARPVWRQGEVQGVVVTKIDLAPLESAWARSGERVLVADPQGVVTLAASSAWKFATLAPLPQDVRTRLANTRQYYTSPLQTLPFIWHGSDSLSLGRQDYLIVSRQVGRLGWRMMLLGDTRPAREQAWQAGAVSGLAVLALTLAALYARLRLRRVRERLAAQLTLERTVAERTAELAAANLRLQDEVSERLQAEQALRDTQAELIRTGKLAALGRMATGIAHELNQPLAALRSFADNTRLFLARGRLDDADGNLTRILRETDKLAAMTAELKLFATRRPVRGDSPLAELQQVMEQALANSGVQCHWQYPPGASLPLDPLAAEQLLGNLLRNAADAMAKQPQRDIHIALQSAPGQVILQVSDNGPGLPADNPQRVLEPFYSTKAYGHGLGLGLAIVAGIVRDAGGHIEAANLPQGGASFTLHLPQMDTDTP